MLTKAEQYQLLVEWNNTQVDYSQNMCIHQLFETQVERSPNAVAVVFEDEVLTYQVLNEKANRLAQHLRLLGVKPGILVGICVERSLDMVISLLAILKAGGAYVPLDPGYPEKRLAFMLDNSQVSILLTQQNLIEKFSKQVNVICFDTLWEKISEKKEVNQINVAKPKNLAYVIYTSGSTGNPKGVMMRHVSLVNLILWQIKNPIFFSKARTLQFASLSFDVSFQEIFSTWCSGGTLILLSDKIRKDPIALIHLLKKEAVERLFLPFVALQQLAEVVNYSGLLPISLREVITAGEQLKITPAITNLFKKLPKCTLHNHYGPSESHVVTTFTLNGLVENWPALPPIGRPIANTQIYILDGHMQPVSIGTVGELYIGGISLAQGYLNRPNLTAEKFIPNPFSDESGSRLYKTGDLARYLEDGNIEYLNRIDNQVKIRGFRIELGEIEVLLNQYPGVRETVLTVREDIPGDKRLVAYIVQHQEQVLMISELRNFLREKLPDYMIPSAFVMLDALPLMPNGKIDRHSLPAPDTFKNYQEDSSISILPRNTLELQLARIWSDILDIYPIGVKDDFFDLGGHSLVAVSLMNRIEQRFGKTLPLTTLFENPTIEQQAFLLYQQNDVEVRKSL